MSDFVDVRPAPELRTELARYVVAADAHTRMSGPGVFRLRRDVFTHMPEFLLDGALIGGTPYRSVAEEPDTGSTSDDTGDDTPSDTSAPEGDTGADTAAADALTCPDCGKVAASPAGLAAHRRAKHEES